MKLRRKKESDLISRQVFQSAVIGLELSWNVVRREKRKQLYDSLLKEEYIAKFKGVPDQNQIHKQFEAVKSE